MSIRLLRTLIAISEHGSFRAAADAVFVSHAAVSQQMKSLEEELQVTLFDRNKRSPELNQLGRSLVLKAREVVHAYDTMVNSLVGDEGLIGELTIGAVPTTMTKLIPYSIAALRQDYPQLHIRVVPGLSGDLLPQVERGALDAAVISEPHHMVNYLSWHPFAEEELVVLAPIDAPYDDPISILQNYPFIRFTRRAWVGVLIEQWLREMKLSVKESMELETLETISSMVFHNLGVSIVPLSCMQADNRLPMKRIPLGPAAKPRILGIIARKDSIKFRIIDALLTKLAHSLDK